MKICLINKCDKQTRREKADWCEKHYMRWYRTGDPEGKRTRSFKDLTDERFGTLLALRPDRSLGHMHWVCQCDCGAEKSIRASTLVAGRAKTCGDITIHPRRSDATYISIHDWLQKDIGKASQFPCVDCGKIAYHWAYDHKDPDEKWSQERAYLVPYSSKLEHYDPMCVKCHKKRDISERPKLWHNQL